MFGFHGKCLTINLTKQTWKVENIAQEILYDFLGGRGLGAYFLSQGKEISLDPFHKDARIVISVGPLTNTKVPTSGRSSMTFKSPLTQLITDSNAGGHLGAKLKACGFDAFIVEGKAEQLLTLHITPQGVEFISVNDLIQKTTVETHALLSDKFGSSCSIACIGPAGENGVLFASVTVDGKGSFDRGGGGAVWGSKNLKAIVVDGDIETAISDNEKLEFMLYEMRKQLTANPITSKALPEFGTSVLVNVMNSAGVMPTYNFLENFSPEADNISGEELTGTLLKNKHACFNCPIACGRTTKVEGEEGYGPEYETVFALGSACGIFDLRAITKANYLCNALGMDTLSTGVTIACAMEMHTKGYLKEKISFGDSSTQYQLIKDIAFKKGIGEELSKGSKKFAENLGHPEFAMQVKGLELPAYDPRAAQGQGLAYATSNQGGCHLHANMILPEILGVPKMVDRAGINGKAGLLIVMQHTYAIFDSLALCKFCGFAISDEFLARILTAVTGKKFEPMDLQKIGERIWNTERIFNIKAGLNPEKDDTLPERLLNQGSTKGPAAGEIVNLKPMLEEYYRFRSWTAEGVPTKEKIIELGLEY